MKCLICTSLRVPVSARRAEAWIPCRSSTVCVVLVCADAEGSACDWASAGVVLEIRRPLKMDDEGGERGGSLAA